MTQSGRKVAASPGWPTYDVFGPRVRHTTESVNLRLNVNEAERRALDSVHVGELGGWRGRRLIKMWQHLTEDRKIWTERGLRN